VSEAWRDEKAPEILAAFEAEGVRRRAHAMELRDRAMAELAASSPEAKEHRVKAQARAQQEAQEARDAALVATAKRFLEGGGAVGWLEFQALPDDMKGALSFAGRALLEEHAQAVARAIMAAATPRPADPLEVANRAALAEAAGRVT
jgi:hypothetical protein